MSTHFTADMSHEPSHDQKLSPLSWLAIIAGAVAMAFVIFNHLAHHGEAHGHKEVHLPNLWQIGILPFVGILGSIAILPLIPSTAHWWESNKNRLGVALVCAGLTLLFYLTLAGEKHPFDKIMYVLDHAIAMEYIPFIVLLFSLYVISGGINLQGDLSAHPLTNTSFLAIGAGIASFIGTTGASMLLIRPLLQTNAERKHVAHTVVFFIFLVSNIGGTLLPIGDPPLFLGFLYGVPFFWTMGLWKEWALCCVILLVIYFIWDTLAYQKETIKDIQKDRTERKPLKLTGWVNLPLLFGVVACVAFIKPGEPFLGMESVVPPPFVREFVMLLLVGASLLLTSKSIREANKFNYHAILEVAALFLGIFIAMQVPLEVLKANGAELSKIINQPWHFFWATGGLSAFLDNAPTYVVFFELSKGIPVAEGTEMLMLEKEGAGQIPLHFLIAVSLGAVFMGAMTYIGNGPNFMVKSIAEQAGVKMPSFFGYMVKYSIPVLVPVFILITFIFLL